MSEDAARQRLDKWLWFARFYKSRTLAAAACNGGKIRVNRAPVAKANTAVKVGDVLTFARGPHVRVIEVAALGVRRGPAPEAATLYVDLQPPEPRKAAPESQEQAHRAPGSGRPTKRDRRQIDRIRGLES